MHIKVWGPIFWTYLHAYAELFFDQPNDQSMKFLTTFSDTIPCPECQEHFKTYLNLHSLEGDLRKYIFNLHNSVNRRLKKKEITWQFYTQEVSKQFTTPSAKHNHSCTPQSCSININYFLIVFVAVLLLMCILLVFKYRACKAKLSTLNFTI